MSDQVEASADTPLLCPECGDVCWQDSVDIGVGVIYGPWGCACGWSADAASNQITGSGGWQPDGTYVDPRGGIWPAENIVTQLMRAAETAQNKDT